MLFVAAPVAQAANHWAPVGRKPLSDPDAAALVTRKPETRPENVVANLYVPTTAELEAFRSSRNIYGQTPEQWNPLFRYVTGRSGLNNPSTDDLVQWAARKWGIPAPWMRAVMVVESSWRQTHMGDRRTVPLDWYGRYPFQAQILGTFDVFQSMGVMQIKWTPDGTASPGTEALRWKSTAFNLDYYGAKIRYYYDGLCDWCTGSMADASSGRASAPGTSPHRGEPGHRPTSITSRRCSPAAPGGATDLAPSQAMRETSGAH